MSKIKYPGKRVTTNGNQLVAQTEARICECGVFYPITPSTEQGEAFEMSVAQGVQTVFGEKVKAIEAEGEHAAQGGAIAMSVTGKRVANFTSGQGIVYGVEQYYHAPGKLSTMVLNIGARALTKHALNVHCGHDDIMAVLDTGWIMLMAKDAQQAVDQSLILRRVTELTLTPGMNIQDGFLTTHLERTFLELESGLIREFLGHPGDMIDTPTEAQKELFGEKRRRVPKMYNLKTPLLLGSVQNQEHYMTGIVARRKSFHEPILKFIKQAYQEFESLTGRKYSILDGYNCEASETIFISLGSSAENIEAGVDYIKKKYNEEVGIYHLNVIRPFPEKDIVEALRGKKNVIILERTDEPNSGSNPLAKDVRTALIKAIENSQNNVHDYLPKMDQTEMPRIFEGVYGLGSRDFRPEHILGAYEYVIGKISRQDGKKESDGKSFFYLGVEHPYAVCSADKPSLLPEKSISVRIHSIGGWGAITTGKNMAEILGNLAEVSKHKKSDDHEVLHISANPKYGSEKKGAPTNYFLVAARDRIKTNCDLLHVDVVLCCDPKIFTHTNPLIGMNKGGAFIWEANLTEDELWSRIPIKHRKYIIDNQIKVYSLNGFEIAHGATKNESLQTRMQGNSFLGAFFKVSTFLDDHGIKESKFFETVMAQYNKKFGRFGDDVVTSNMNVMKLGYKNTKPVNYGHMEAKDNSSITGEILSPCNTTITKSTSNTNKNIPIFDFDNYKKEYIEGDTYNQQASPLTSCGVMPAGTGEENSKYVSRIDIPIYDPNKCTQCMACIAVCPDTALPNTAQDISTILNKIYSQYITKKEDKKLLLDQLSNIESEIRIIMNESIAKKEIKDLKVVINNISSKINISENSKKEISNILEILPLGYGKARSIFQQVEKKAPGEGGIFTIFVSDKCKGCAACVDACGDHDALRMEKENGDIRAKHLSAVKFYNTLPQTPKKYLGLFDPEDIKNTRAAALHNHLMIQKNYNAFVSGDGSCAGCGEKSILRGIVTMTEALMRTAWDKKVARALKISTDIKTHGEAALKSIKENNPDTYLNLKMTIQHAILNKGGESLTDSKERITKLGDNSDTELISALALILETDANNHKKHQVIDGTHQGMTVMGMTASTGCNTVYGSTHPSNPHKYPWMNSLFQDGATIGWLVGESFIMDHIKTSVLPERIANHILAGVKDFSENDYLNLMHFSDSDMTELEILELPKVWAVGGDGALGDIGFQNLSKVVLQNRPNINILMLDTQVYSNTGGQNSDSSVMPGGYDMNQFGNFSEGKLTERKEVAQILTTGHGSPFIAAVSMANTAKFYKAVLDGLLYRGSTFIQSYTTCQPEHGVGDNKSQIQALAIRDSRGAPEFVFNPDNGELDSEAFDIKANPRVKRDWQSKKDSNKESYEFNTVQWAFTEGRFRKHFISLKKEEELINLNDLLLRLSQPDIVNRNFMNPNHRSYIPTKGVYTDIILPESGKIIRKGITRQMVLFTVERRKNWRKLQNRAGIINPDYLAQKAMLAKYDSNEISKEDFYNDTQKLYLSFYEK